MRESEETAQAECLCYKFLRLRGSAKSIYRHAQSRFVPVSRVFLKHAFADRVVNRGKRWTKQCPRGRGIFRGNRSAQLLHDGSHASRVRAIDFRAHAGLLGSLDYRFLTLLYFYISALLHSILLYPLIAMDI